MPDDGSVEGPGRDPGFGLHTTAYLIERIRGGDATARDRLVERFLPALLRWAHGRLPSYARDLHETGDLVQNALLRALDKVKDFRPERPGAFLAYLRRIVLNEVKDEIRRVRRRPGIGGLDDRQADEGPSPVEQAIGRERLERYEAALTTLTEAQQEAVMMRLELGFDYRQIAEAIGCPTANAARMFVARAVERLAETMRD